MAGQKSQRKKWIHLFENITSVLFFVSLNEFDENLEEDETLVGLGLLFQHEATLLVSTVMRIIKLNLFPVPVRLHSGSGKLKLYGYFNIFFDI